MKLLQRNPSNPRPRQSGGALLITIVLVTVIGISLQSYMTFVAAQNRSVVRSLSWNSAIPILEAGIEEAMCHINNNLTTTNWGVDGWTLSDSVYWKRRSFSEGYYVVGVSNTTSPTIYATGYAVLPLTTNEYISRTVVVSTVKDGMFMKGMVAKGVINMNGNNIRSDSFNSSDGPYSDGTAKDNGDIATNSGLENSLNVGNANIFGRVATGPGGSISIGSNGAVGSKTWQAAGNKGIQPNWSSNDMNVSFPDVSAPFTGGYSTPAAGTVDGTRYTYVLGAGNYGMSSLSMSGRNSLIVTGQAVLYVTGDFSMSGNSQIIIQTNASLKIYVAGSSGSIGGNGVANQTGSAANFSYWGLPSNTSVSYSGNAAFMGTLYAPQAALTLGGGGRDTIDFIGASVSSTVSFNGHFSFHYDELLGTIGPSRGYVISGWNEI